MTQDRRSLRALAALLPSGILGLSMSLAAADASAKTTAAIEPDKKGTPESVALRLEAIRNTVSVVVRIPMAGDKEQASDDDQVQLAWWGNGWRNGGWRNGGWGNGGLVGGVLHGLFGGGWGNGWHNGGWGNGGWHNGGWGNGGWHNGGWHNGWHNW